MTVLKFRPRAYYAVAPGQDGPVFYERTLDGLNSAIAHAELLSAGGGRQVISLTEGKVTRVVLEFEGGRDVTGTLLPPPFLAGKRPQADQVRPGSPNGHIPEICSRTRNKGKKSRRSPNMPKTPPYETTLAQIQQTLGEMR